MNLLFSIDDAYVDQWKVTLFSIVHNSNFQELSVYILQKEALTRNAEILDFCQRLGVTYYPVVIGKNEFQDAPTSKRYPETIYYRLLAHEYLPQDLDKVLYIDADILCLNDIFDFYETDLGENLYAAASHIADSNIRDLINKARLGNFEAASYVNSGVLLMNLDQIRKKVKVYQLLGEGMLGCSLASKKDCAIIISYSGETKTLLRYMAILQQNQVPTILITNIGDSTLARNADYLLRMSTRERLYSKIGTFANDTSIIYLLDLLYSCVFKENYQKNLDLRITTSKVIETTRQSNSKFLRED